MFSVISEHDTRELLARLFSLVLHWNGSRFQYHLALDKTLPCEKAETQYPMTMIKYFYDKEADAMYIYLSEDKKSTRTEEIREGILVDYSGKEMVGIEILNASEKLAKKSLDEALSNSSVYMHEISK